MKYLSTTVKGIEDLAAKEIEGYGGRIDKILPGKVVYEGDDNLFYVLNYNGKKINRVVQLLGIGEISNLEDIKEIVRSTDIPYGRYSLGVRTERTGHHEFRSIDVSAAVGEVLLELNPEARVNLDDPDVPIMAWVIDDLFMFGVDTTGRSLHRRGYRVAKHPASLNPVIASAMVSLSEWKGGIFADPFCGSGTVLIEAYHLKRKVPNIFRDFHFIRLPWFDNSVWMEIKEKYSGFSGSEPELLGIDENSRFIEAAIKNAEQARVRMRCMVGDAREMYRYVGNVSSIVTNPPYGLRMGNRKKVYSLYEQFAEMLEEYFSGITFVVITPISKFEHYFTVIEKRDILYGDLHAWLYKMKI